MKFICYNMLIVTAVIRITFCAVAFVMEKQVSAQGRLGAGEGGVWENITGLHHPFACTRRRISPLWWGRGWNGDAVREGGYGNISGTEGILEEMAFLGMAGEGGHGASGGYHLRYLRVSRPTGYMIAFADTSYEDTLRNGVMQYGGLACAGIWIGFPGAVYFFSRWAVKPVEESIRMQKQFGRRLP